MAELSFEFKHFFDIHPFAKSAEDRLTWNIQSFSPFSNAKSFAIIGKHAISALIAVLLFMCRPSDITRFIITIIIRKSINTVEFARTWANIRQKYLKGIPSFATFNASTSIIFIRTIIKIIAALQNCMPNSIFRSSATAMFGFSPISISSNLRFQATTTFRKITSQIVSINYCLSSAIAAAKPIQMMAFILSSIFHDCPSVEFLANQIYKLWAGWKRSIHNILLLTDYTAKGIMRKDPIYGVTWLK